MGFMIVKRIKPGRLLIANKRLVYYMISQPSTSIIPKEDYIYIISPGFDISPGFMTSFRNRMGTDKISAISEQSFRSPC